MKKFFSALALIAITGFSLTCCSDTPAESNGASKGKATDYSRKESWLQIPEITKDVDTFYIYSTAYYESSFEEGAPDYATLDNPEMLEGAQDEYMTNASVYEESTNVFVPYYRQAGMRYAGEVLQKTGDIDAALSGISYDDIRAALDCFFEKHNNGRPFIIAGHSQGAAMVKYVLKNYFKEHPDYYKRMVAAYVIGFSVTKDDLEKYPHLKFATGESDTGVIVSWNTEGPKNVKENARNAVVLPGAISINPLNWKLDDTYASASENLGSFMPNVELLRYEITDIGADAQVVLKRGVIVTNAKWDHPADPEFFGPQSFHEDDYTFYYNNLKDNVAKRVAAYKASAGDTPDYSKNSCWYKIPDITKDVDTFQHTIHSIGARMEIKADHLVEIGDWIVMESGGILDRQEINGIVTEISMHTVKVRNWDNALVCFPICDLVNKPFINYSSKEKDGGRCIKKTLLINQRSIRSLSAKGVEILKGFDILKDYLESKGNEPDQYNTGRSMLNSRQLTNLGIFRVYAKRYLEQNPNIRADQMLFVRELAPKNTDLPIEIVIYCFSREVQGVPYEEVQSEITEYLLATLPRFGLRVFQRNSDIYQEFDDHFDIANVAFLFDRLKKTNTGNSSGERNS